MDDLWRPVVGFEELYEVSSDGRVRKRNGEELHQRVDKKKYTNYRRVSLKGTNGTVNEFVHRIVAQAFLPQKEGCNIINHKDENGENNHVENLEWCNRSYNARYGSSLLKIKSAATGRISEKRKPVLQFDADGKVVGRYESAQAAAKAVSGAQSNISAACLGEKITAYGYKWEYVDRVGERYG